MTKTMLCLILAAVASASCTLGTVSQTGSQTGEMSRAVIDPYLKISEALASDDIEGVKMNAGEIATAATALGALAIKIDTSAVQLSAAADLADAREKFGALSEAIDLYMTSQHFPPPEGVRVAFCPMVKKPWLQTDGSLRNPYYGSQMLTCGSFRN
ncbi:MAG TPA: hypothetical protein VGQ16_09820 [Vicinamibacterales bacterium]|jgi:hypothetical protein|nr:hypothetical protein [Vicinamibacterales bacterium]